MFNRKSIQAPPTDLEDFEVWRSNRALAAKKREQNSLDKAKTEKGFGNANESRLLNEKTPRIYVEETAKKAITARRKPMQSFRVVAFLLFPLATVAIYLTIFATPLYEAQVQFLVQSNTSSAEENSIASIQENQILHSFIESAAFSETLRLESDVPVLFASEAIDPVQRIWTSSHFPVSEKVQLRRFIFSHFDQHSGLISLYTRAPNTALAEELSYDAIEVLANHLENQSNVEDARRAASYQLKFEFAQDKLGDAESALANFRMENGVFNPESDVEASLQSSRAIANQIREVDQQLELMREDGREFTQQYLQLEKIRNSLQTQAASENALLISSQVEPGVLQEFQTLSARLDLARSLYSEAYDQLLRAPRSTANIRIVSPTQASQNAVSPNVFGSFVLALVFFSTLFFFSGLVGSRKEY